MNLQQMTDDGEDEGEGSPPHGDRRSGYRERSRLPGGGLSIPLHGCQLNMMVRSAKVEFVSKRIIIGPKNKLPFMENWFEYSVNHMDRTRRTINMVQYSG